MSTAAEKRHLSRIVALNCMACRRLGYGDETPGEVHHPREGQGGAQRASDWLAICLCPNHHRHGQFALHVMGTTAWESHHGFTELDLLADTIALAYGGRK